MYNIDRNNPYQNKLHPLYNIKLTAFLVLRAGFVRCNSK